MGVPATVGMRARAERSAWEGKRCSILLARWPCFVLAMIREQKTCQESLEDTAWLNGATEPSDKPRRDNPRQFPLSIVCTVVLVVLVVVADKVCS